MARGRDMLVSGFYGAGNLGDEALLLGLLQAVRAADPALATSILSDGSSATEALTGSPAVQRVHGRRRPFFDARAMLGHDLFALGGGGLIKDYGPDSSVARSWLGQLLLASALRRRAMTYAIGVDELRYASSRRLARRSLQAADLVTVRDRGSAVRLRALGVRRELLVTADPAVLLAPAAGGPARAGSPLVAVNVREWLSRGATVERPHLVSRFEAELAAALDALVHATGARVRFVPFRDARHDDDRTACKRVAQLMQTGPEADLVAVPSTSAAAVSALGECDLVIGMRLHSLVLGAAGGVPVFGLAYMPKVAHFLEHAGVGDQSCDLQEGALPGVLTTLLGRAWAEREATRATLANCMTLMRRLALLNGRLAACLARDDEEGLGLARAETLDTARELERAGPIGEPGGPAAGRERLRVAVFPAPFPSNPYHDRLHSELEQRGVGVECPAALTPAWARQATREVDVVHLHWLEHLAPRPAQGPRGVPRALRRAGRTLLALRILRRAGVRLVWTVHNLRPHESGHVLIDRVLFRGVAAQADAVLAHSAHAAQRVSEGLAPPKRIWIAPFGSYAGCYPEEDRTRDEVRAALGLPADSFVYLVFGHLRSYKRVPETIQAFRALADGDARLVVAGRPYDEAQRDAVVQAAAGDARISLHLGHVPDAEVNGFGRAADAAVLGYEEVFSSGALALALTQGLPVVAPAGGSAGELAGGPAIETFSPGRLTEALAAVRRGDSCERRAAALAASAIDTWGEAAQRTLSAYGVEAHSRQAARRASSDAAESR